MMATVYGGHSSSTYHAFIPTGTNSEHSLDIESSGKSLVNDTEDLQAQWKHFVLLHEEDVCAVISTLKFGCSRTHICTGISKCWLGRFPKISSRCSPGLEVNVDYHTNTNLLTSYSGTITTARPRS
jgi:hypothetical protein